MLVEPAPELVDTALAQPYARPRVQGRTADDCRRDPRRRCDRHVRFAVLPAQRRDDRVEGEALARSGAAREKDVLARQREVDGALLLRIELGRGSGGCSDSHGWRGGGSGGGLREQPVNIFELHLQRRLGLYFGRRVNRLWHGWRRLRRRKIVEIDGVGEAFGVAFVSSAFANASDLVIGVAERGRHRCNAHRVNDVRGGIEGDRFLTEGLVSLCPSHLADDGHLVLLIAVKRACALALVGRLSDQLGGRWELVVADRR